MSDPVSSPYAPPATVGGSYDHSVKIQDVGGGSPGNPAPQAPFVDPNPGSKMLGPAWEKASR